jgi:ABC-type bacteriocin/lantibiotic exporter with double-glycine peptidase domain
MQPISVVDVLIQVLTSWQVIAITIAIIAFILLVSYVAQSYHKPRSSKKIKINMFKKKSPQAVVQGGGPEETASGANANDELGLEEAP